MKITILTIGSRGDVQPYVALGIGLKKAGHQVKIATHENFEEFVKERGLEFFPLRGNAIELLESKFGMAMLESEINPVKTLYSMLKLIDPMFEELITDMWSASQGSEALICSTLSLPGFCIAEKLKIPSIFAILQPMIRNTTHSSLFFPDIPNIPVIKPIYNWYSFILTEQVLWQNTKKMTNKMRKELMELPPLPFWGIFSRFYQKKNPIPTILGYSPHVIQREAEWMEWMQITGYWFLDKQENWQPPADLTSFLESGDPPVYIGFGSMRTRNPEETAETVIKALKKSKKRGILMKGWGGLNSSKINDDEIFFIDSVPHDWLFPKMAAVIHHGGAGTTSAGLRAGVPGIIVHFFGDQIFWGKKIHELKVGSKPIPIKKLNSDNLSAAINQVTSDNEIKYHAKKLSEKINSENGVDNAVMMINKHIKAR